MAARKIQILANNGDGQDLADTAMAKMLVSLPSFNLVIDEARKSVGIKVSTDSNLQKMSVLDIMMKYVHKGNPDFPDTLRKTAAMIAERYNLPDYWGTSIVGVILTNKLALNSNPGVEIIEMSQNTNSKNEDTDRELLIGALTYSKSVIISVNKKMSVTKLNELLKNPKLRLSKALDKLPNSTPANRQSEQVLTWGSAIDLLRSEYPRDSWAVTLNRMNAIYPESDLPAHHDDLTSLWTRYVELRKRRFKE